MSKGDYMKTHLYDSRTLSRAPDFVKNRYDREGLKGSACGYVRKATTTNLDEVTCKICLSKTK